MDRPTLNRDADGSTARSAVQSALSWIRGHECPECGDTCEMSHAYDRQEAAFYAESNGTRPTWYCAECDQHYRREDTGWSFGLWE